MRNRKLIAIIVSLVLVMALAINGTFAWLNAKTDPVTNTFKAGQITTQVEETIDGETGAKKDVKIKNTGNIKAYIRAAVVVTWQKEVTENGQTKTVIYPKAPVAGVDYTIEYKLADQANGKWIEKDGYYYWNNPVLSVEENAENCSTGILITSCVPVANKTPEGYHLVVEVLASAIQADGVTIIDGKEVPAVTDAWGVTVDANGRIGN